MSTVTKTNEIIGTEIELNSKLSLNRTDILNSTLGIISSSKLVETVNDSEDTPENQTVFTLFPEDKKELEQKKRLAKEIIEALSKILSEPEMCEGTQEPSSTAPEDCEGTQEPSSAAPEDTDPNDLTGLQNLFLMEASVMSSEQLAIKNMYEQAQQQNQISDAIMAGLEATESKIQDEIKKLNKAHHHHHHHGIFGWGHDFQKAVEKTVKNIAKTTIHAISAAVNLNGKGLEKCGKEYAKEPGFSEIISDINIAKTTAYAISAGVNLNGKGLEKCGKEYVKESGFSKILSGVNEILSGNILEGLETLAICALISTVPLIEYISFFGHSQFSEDLKNAGMIPVDAAAALGRVILAGVESGLGAITGDSKFNKLSKDNIDKCNKLGMNIIENPEFETLADIAMVTMIVAAAMSGQVWLAVILTAVLIANDFGGMEYAQKTIAKILQMIDPKMSDTLAKLIADVIIIVAITVLTAGSGIGEAAADTAADEAADATVDEASESLRQKVLNLAKKITEFFQQSVVSRGLIGFGMVLGQSSIVKDSFAESGNDDKKLELAFTIIQEVLATVAAFVGGAACTTGAASSLAENAEAFSKLAVSLQAIAMLIQGSVQVGNGVLDLIVGKILKILSEIDSENSIFEATSQVNQSAIKQNNKHLQELMNMYGQIVENFNNAFALYGEGVTQALNENM